MNQEVASSVTTPWGSLGDLNSVSVDLDLVIPTVEVSGCLETTIDTYLNDPLLDEEVEQIISSSLIDNQNTNETIDCYSDTTVTETEAERELSNPSLTCHENFRDFEQNLTPPHGEEGNSCRCKPLTPDVGGSAVTPLLSPREGASALTAQPFDPENRRKRKLEFSRKQDITSDILQQSDTERGLKNDSVGLKRLTHIIQPPSSAFSRFDTRNEPNSTSGEGSWGN